MTRKTKRNLRILRRGLIIYNDDVELRYVCCHLIDYAWIKLEKSLEYALVGNHFGLRAVIQIIKNAEVKSNV